MDVREKLVELVHNARMNALWHNAKNPSEYITDMLMEDGVTVQEWISVKDRLPEELPENHGKKVIQCLVSLKSTYPNGKPNTQKRQRQLQWYGAKGWKWEWSRIGACRVTHWMPLPEPPKGE